jgi:O-antigen ligase
MQTRMPVRPLPGQVLATPSPSVITALQLPEMGAALAALAYVLISYGRLAETFLPIPLIAFATGGLALLLTAIVGNLMRAATSRSGILLIFLTIWLIICTPFSEWVGGSLGLLKDHWFKSIAVFFLIAGNIVTLRLYRWFTSGVAASVVLILLALKLRGVSQAGRLELDIGTLTNSNDLAAHLLIGLPFLLLIIDVKTLKSIWGWIALALTGGLIVMVLNTGSRAGLVTLFALLTYRFIRGSIAVKVILVLVAAIGLMTAPFFVSPESLERYMSLFGRISSDTATSRQVEFAEDSAEARQRLLQESLIAILHHPVFGIGPGMFQVYLADKTKAEGERAQWAQTHNSFTQMASECGIPAGILYLLIVFRALRNGRTVWKAASKVNGDKQLAASGEALVTALVSFVAAASFGNYAYMMYVPMLAGCGEALCRIAEKEGGILPAKQIWAGTSGSVKTPARIGLKPA